MEFFSDRELACKGSGEIKLDPLFEAELPELRRAWGRPLIANSVCRSPQHNRSVGGHPNSLHLTENPTHKTKGTAAADLSWRGWSKIDQLRFARLAWARGWSVGLHNSFIHVDRRDAAGLPQACFLYGSWDGRFTVEEVRRG
jgi:hypothetical protein